MTSASDEADSCVQELLCWVDIANRCTNEIHLVNIVSNLEPESRSDIFMESAMERSQIVSRFALAVGATVAKAAEELQSIHAQIAQGKGELTDLPRRIEVKEAALLKEMQARYEVRVSEFSEGGAKLAETRAKLQAEVADLTKRREEELSTLTAFRIETDERRTRLQQLKQTSASEMRELEEALDALRAKVAAEKALLASLEDEEAVKRKKIDVLSDMSANLRGTSSSSLIAARSATDAGNASATTSGGSPPSQSDSQQQQVAVRVSAKLDYGLSTLQSVRDQLRDIRESSLSPRRGTTSGISAVSTSTAASTLPRSGSTTVDQHPDASPHQAASPVVNPWKERLRQLQGDLQLLRADLGASK